MENILWEPVECSMIRETYVCKSYEKRQGDKDMMEQLSLFDDREQSAPLASRLRPESLEEYVGQRGRFCGD